MPLFTHQAWRSDPGISLQGMNFRQRVNIMFPGLIPAFYLYTAITVGKTLMGYPYLFEGGHKISFTRLFGVGEPHAVMGAPHRGVVMSC